MASKEKDTGSGSAAPGGGKKDAVGSPGPTGIPPVRQMKVVGIKNRLSEGYYFNSDKMPVNVKIRTDQDLVPIYELTIPGLAEGTRLILNTLRGELITKVKVDITDVIDPKKVDEVKKKFEDAALELLNRQFPSTSDETKYVLVSYVLQHTLGLGEIEPLMHDDYLEEVVVNGANEPIWVYHKKYGWCKTNIQLKSEAAIYDIASSIGRKIGKQISVLNPLMDAHLPTGERVNATLFPVSNHGNTITIRKFSSNPWTIPTLMELNCISGELSAFIWLCIQYELSFLISGGTGSGKTSFLNAIATMIPPNQRVVSIEDTRELALPSFLHWVPMVTREANVESRGEVTMLNLLVNALRQRPDRILVGEVRKQREAEILFEAMHTGHSVYATIHADNSAETITRLTTPPINMPVEVVDSLAGIIVQYRQRRLGIRRTLEFAEMEKGGSLRLLYKWNPRADSIAKVNDSINILSRLASYTGMSQKEMLDDIAEKKKVLEWSVKNRYNDIERVGKVMAAYYKQKDELMDAVTKDKKWI